MRQELQFLQATLTLLRLPSSARLDHFDDELTDWLGSLETKQSSDF